MARMKKGISKPTYKMKLEEDVFVKMRDGVSLCVDVYRPTAEGKYPALLAISPYGKEIQALPIAPMPTENPLYNVSIECGDPEYIVSRGYVMVIVDERGIGKSGGEYDGWMSKNEAFDGYDVVEWAAKQPWCNGKVGLTGISYFGTVQWHIAAEQPPHLKAIMPFNAPADFYRECSYHGGVLQSFFYNLYMKCIRGNTASTVVKSKSARELEKIVKQMRNNPDIRMYTDYFNVAVNYRFSPCFFDVLATPFDGPYYWGRSAYTKYDRIKVPAYMSTGWWAFAHMHLRGQFQNYLGLNVPKKLEIRSIIDRDRPLPEDYNEQVIQWFDYWLKDIDTGIMDEPPIKLFIQGENKWRFENEWPLARTKWTKLYLRDWGRLSTETTVLPSRPAVFTQRPLEETIKVESVSYMTEPMTEDTEITGHLALYLNAAIDKDDTNWMVGISDVAPDGSEHDLSRGWLKASHRAFDAKKSKPWLPWHPHTYSEPVTPGEVTEYIIEISPIANLFKVGHRLKLKISSMDHARLPFPITMGATHLPYHMCSSQTVTHYIHHDINHPSYLLAPIVPRK